MNRVLVEAERNTRSAAERKLVIYSSSMVKGRAIVGHATVLEELERDLEALNVAHAYLFSGPEHIGKTNVAHWFATELLLKGVPEEKHENVQTRMEKLTHPDFLSLDQLWIEGVCEDWDTIAKTSNAPQQHRAKKPAAKTDVISIDDVRSLQERLYETGTGQYRCCFIRAVGRMQTAAANAFLKILEEPPEGLVFLLTTQSFSTLPPTIISRTRVVRMQRLSYAELAPLLEDAEEEDRKFILHIAQGAPGTICALRDNPDLLREHKLLHSKAFSFWQSHSLKDRLQILVHLHKRGEESDRFLLHLALTIREHEVSSGGVKAFNRLVRGLGTNAHRQLLAQQFALSV